MLLYSRDSVIEGNGQKFQCASLFLIFRGYQDYHHLQVHPGWNLRPEFESALVVLILLMVVYLNSVRLVTQLPPGGAIGLLPGLGNDPSAEEVLASGSAGSGSDTGGLGQNSDNQQDTALNDLFDLTSSDFEVISKILQDLGEALDQEFEFPGEQRDLGVIVSQGDEVLSLNVGEFVLISIVKVEATSVDESGVDFRYTHSQSESDSLQEMNEIASFEFRVNYDGTTSGDIQRLNGLEIWNFRVREVSGGVQVNFSTMDNRITVRQ